MAGDVLQRFTLGSTIHHGMEPFHGRRDGIPSSFRIRPSVRFWRIGRQGTVQMLDIVSHKHGLVHVPQIDVEGFGEQQFDVMFRSVDARRAQYGRGGTHRFEYRSHTTPYFWLARRSASSA